MSIEKQRGCVMEEDIFTIEKIKVLFLTLVVILAITTAIAGVLSDESWKVMVLIEKEAK